MSDVEPAPVAAPDMLDTAEAGRRVMVGGAMRLAGYAAGLIASVVAAAVLFRHFDQADYGRFSTVLALVTGLQIVTDFGLASLGVREFVQRRGQDRDEFMRVVLGMRLVTTALLVATASSAAVLLGYTDEMIIGAVLFAVGASLTAVGGTVAIPLAAEIRMGVITALDVGRQFATAVAYVVLALAGAGLVAFLGVAIPIAAAIVIVTVLLVRGSFPLRPSFSVQAWREFVLPTLTFALATAAGSIYVYGAMVVTELVTSDYETGLFGAAFRVYIILSTFPVLLVTTAFPVLSRAARDDSKRLRYAAQRLIDGTTLLAGAVVIALVLGADPIIRTLATADYLGAVPALRIQGVALAMTFVIATLGFTLMALHRHRAVITCNLAALSVSAPTVILLGSADGARGASVGVLLGELVLLAGYLIALRHGKTRVMLEAGTLARVTPPLALGLAVWFLPVAPVLQLLIGLTVYAGGLLITRALPAELAAMLPAPLGSRLRTRV